MMFKENKENKLLRKYYLLTDASVKRLKEIDRTEKEFSNLDRKMKQVLYRKIPPYSKWQLYNSLLTEYDTLRRQTYEKYGKKKTKEMEIQTDKIQTPVKDTTIPIDNDGGENAVDNNNRLDYLNDFESRDNSRFFNNLETELNGEGELQSLSPNSSRRLTAASAASATKKSAVAMRHHLMPEPTFIHDDSTILEEEDVDEPTPSTSAAAMDESYVLQPPKKKQREYSITSQGKDRSRKNALSLVLDNVIYYVHKDDYEDFKDFAAEKRKKNPNQMLYEKEFQKWQKKKDADYQQFLAREQNFLAKAAEVDAQRKQQKKDEQMARLLAKRRAEEEERRKEEDRAAIFAEQEVETAPKSRNRRSGEHKPSKKGGKKEKPDEMQPSVAQIFPKRKSGGTSTAKQRGHGKRIRWISIK